jgi:UDP-glucuronate decarboxylase
VARIFNTYGPRMALDDGRVVSNFVKQAIEGKPMTIHGVGCQTRSFQYIDDLVKGIIKLMDGEHTGPFNIGNLCEFTMLELAEKVKKVVNPDAKIVFKENTADDPSRRQPDILKAKGLLGWEPVVPLEEGLRMITEDFKGRITSCRNSTTQG